MAVPETKHYGFLIQYISFDNRSERSCKIAGGITQYYSTHTFLGEEEARDILGAGCWRVRCELSFHVHGCYTLGMVDRVADNGGRLVYGIAPGFANIACRYVMVGSLFCVPGIAIIAMSWRAIHTPFSPFIACLAGIALGSLFMLIGAGILGGGCWWLRRATRVLRHTSPIHMHMHTHTRMVHDGAGPGPGDAVTTAFARLTPIDPAIGIRTFKRVPLEWPAWRLRWHPPAESAVLVYYNFITGGPLVIQMPEGTLLLSQIFWDRQRRKRKTPPVS